MTTHRFEHNEWTHGAVESDRFQSASFVRGVSLSAVLQMLHLERKTCVLEVVSDDQFGTLTLVNGELVDAGAGELDGEEAVYRILTWPHPRTTILDGVNLFRHSVGLPLSQLLVELVRRQDEGESRPSTEPTTDVVVASQPLVTTTPADVNRLVEAMVISGALAAAVFESDTGALLSLADEFGGTLDGLSAAALTDVIPTTAALREWLRKGDADDLVVRLDGLHLLLTPLDSSATRFAYALLESTDGIERVRSACRLNASI
jgi:hypothetical protein